MAVLKQIKFGTGNATPIAQTKVKVANQSVLSVNENNTDINNANDPEYTLDLNIDGTTLVKHTEGEGTTAVNKLKVGVVPATQVSVAAGGHVEGETDDKTFVGDVVEEVLLELNDKINETGNIARTYTIVDDTDNDKTLPTNVAKRYRLQETIGTQSPTLVGANIDIPKDSSLVEVYLGANTDTINATTGEITKNTVTDPQSMNFAYHLADGTYSLTKIDVSKFLTESEFGDGLTVSNTGVVSINNGNGLGFDSSDPKKVQVVIDSTSETDSQATPSAFLSVGSNGIKVQGIKDEIDRKIAALDVTDTAVDGQYVSQVSETDGKVSVTRANVSQAVLNEYTKGSDATPVAATDTINQAFSKLENQIAEVSTELDDEIAARKAVDGQSGNTYVANANTSHINSATSLNDADVKLDTAITNEETRSKQAETAIDGAIGLEKGANDETRTYTNQGEYIGKSTTTNTVKSDIKALDTQLKIVSDKVDGIKYNVSGTTLIFSGISEDSTLS